MEDLPFLAIESDGSPFPQLISAKLETFCLRAERLHKKMVAAGKKNRDQENIDSGPRGGKMDIDRIVMPIPREAPGFSFQVIKK